MGIFRPRIDYIDLITALSTHYKADVITGGIYANSDELEDDRLASITARNGAFKALVNHIFVYNKSIDHYFQSLLGLDYYKIRVDRISEENEDDEDYEDDD